MIVCDDNDADGRRQVGVKLPASPHSLLLFTEVILRWGVFFSSTNGLFTPETIADLVEVLIDSFLNLLMTQNHSLH